MASEAVRQLLIAMYERDGKLEPVTLVDEARDPDSPLHEHFEWDDAIAAHDHRIAQARELIRRERITIISETSTVTYRTWLHAGGTYRPASEVMTTEHYRAEVLERMQHDADLFALRYRKYATIPAVKEVLDALDGARHGVADPG